MKKKLMFVIFALFSIIGFSCNNTEDEFNEIEILEVPSTDDDDDDDSLPPVVNATSNYRE